MVREGFSFYIPVNLMGMLKALGNYITQECLETVNMFALQLNVGGVKIGVANPLVTGSNI